MKQWNFVQFGVLIHLLAISPDTALAEEATCLTIGTCEPSCHQNTNRISECCGSDGTTSDFRGDEVQRRRARRYWVSAEQNVGSLLCCVRCFFPMQHDCEFTRKCALSNTGLWRALLVGEYFRYLAH